MRSFIVAGIAAGVLLCRPAFAFKEAGHRAIEQAAYLDLLKTEEGRAVLERLILRGVLAAPQRPYPEPSALDPEFARHAVNGLVLGTHMPDHLLDRQFDKDLQCFHFNARGSHVTKVPGQVFGVPRGLVEHAYIDCLGVADSLLRNVVFAPAGSASQPTGIYSLMHMIEDSFADSHVARAADHGYKIIYVKPWTLRTWWSYFIADHRSTNDALREHFSHTHHTMSDSRDLGYLIGPNDSEQCGTCRDYQARVAQCLADAAPLFGQNPDLEDLEDLEDEVIVPPSCLSERALTAKSALVDLLKLVDRHVTPDSNAAVMSREAARSLVELPKVLDHRAPSESNAVALAPNSSDEKCPPSFADDWLVYRKRYLAHVNEELTETMALPESCPDGKCQDIRGNLVYPADRLIPRAFRTAGVGLSSELTAGTPLWLGFEAFVAANAGSHSKINPLTDFMGYALQIRLPIENELGERPIGLAIDFGPTLPVPISELAADDPTNVALYLGLRGRGVYSAQSVFENETRHVASFGFGGVSLDFVVGNRVWFGADFPRIMWNYDSWTQSGETSVTWNFNGGVAVDAF